MLFFVLMKEQVISWLWNRVLNEVAQAETKTVKGDNWHAARGKLSKKAKRNLFFPI